MKIACKKCINFKNAQGFTLIEILIVLVITNLVAMAAFAAFNSQHKSYIIQEQVAEMQQNLRVSMEMITQDLMMAGYQVGSTVGYEIDESTALAKNPSILITNSSTEPDQIAITYVNPDFSNLPELTILNTHGSGGNSAETEIDEEISSSPYNLWDDYYDTVKVSPGYFKAIITDGTKCDIVYVTQVQNNGPGNNDNIQHHRVQVDGVFYDNRAIGNYPPGSRLVFWTDDNQVTYKIVTNASGNPELQVQQGSGAFQSVAENIENMQFAYILQNGTEIYETGGDSLAEADYENIRAIRITLVARTNREDPDWTSSGRPAAEDYEAVEVSDRYRRRTITSTIKIRNFGL